MLPSARLLRRVNRYVTSQLLNLEPTLTGGIGFAASTSLSRPDSFLRRAKDPSEGPPAFADHRGSRPFRDPRAIPVSRSRPAARQSWYVSTSAPTNRRRLFRICGTGDYQENSCPVRYHYLPEECYSRIHPYPNILGNLDEDRFPFIIALLNGPRLMILPMFQTLTT